MSSFEYQLSLWSAQRDQRHDLNDVLSVPRDVEHFVHFRRRRPVRSVADDLSVAGFTVGLGRRGLKRVLQATRTESLSEDMVEQFLREVITIVERHGGDYDGWGAAVQAQTNA